MAWFHELFSRRRRVPILGAGLAWLAVSVPACGSSSTGASSSQGSDACATFAAKVEQCGMSPSMYGCPTACLAGCYVAAPCSQVFGNPGEGPGSLAACMSACSTIAGSGAGASGNTAATSTGSGTGAAGTGGATSVGSSSGSGGGLRCLDTGGSCICLDPAPNDYDATTCSAYPCCWKDLSQSPAECACSTFTGQACTDWRSGPAVASCP